MANERHTDARGWEIDFSTRQAVHPYTRYNPFRAATSTTVSTLFTVSRGETATNWVTNPRVETALSTQDGFTATGSAISRSTAQQSLGAASLLVNPDNSAADEGAYWDSPTIPFSVHPQHITVQCEHRGASASGAVTLEIQDTSGNILATSGTDDLATSWRRLTAQYTIAGSTAAAAYRLSITTTAQHNIDFYVDKFMFEVREDTIAVSTYVDGDSGINYEWTGTANASTSIKKPGLALIRGITLKNESGTAADVVFVAFDTIATATTGVPVIGGGTLDTNFPLAFLNKITVIAAQNTPTVSGAIWGTHYV